jgi:signal transduction histidine kinase
VEDNGKGFEVGPRELPSGRGLGVDAMQDYANAVGGACTIWSTPGRGTTITARLPFDDGSAAGLER